MLFTRNKKTLTAVNQKPFNAEKELQVIIEENLEKIFGLGMVKSEYTIKDRKIDTLAYNKLQRAFVIIEYKKEKNLSVFDQGMTYLGLLLENRGELINEFNETRRGSENRLSRNGVKWRRTKIIFISPEFTANQLRSAGTWQLLTAGNECVIELWTAALYENGMLELRQATKYDTAERNPVITDEQQRLHNKPDWTRKLYEDVKETILGIDKNIKIKHKKLETGFVYCGKIIADISVHMAYLRMWLNMKKGTLKDPHRLARDVSAIRHWGSGDYELKIRDTKNLAYISGLVRQSLSNMKLKM